MANSTSPEKRVIDGLQTYRRLAEEGATNSVTADKPQLEALYTDVVSTAYGEKPKPNALMTRVLEYLSHKLSRHITPFDLVTDAEVKKELLRIIAESPLGDDPSFTVFQAQEFATQHALQGQLEMCLGNVNRDNVRKKLTEALKGPHSPTSLFNLAALAEIALNESTTANPDYNLSLAGLISKLNELIGQDSETVTLVVDITISGIERFISLSTADNPSSKLERIRSMQNIRSSLRTLITTVSRINGEGSQQLSTLLLQTQYFEVDLRTQILETEVENKSQVFVKQLSWDMKDFPPQILTGISLLLEIALGEIFTQIQARKNPRFRLSDLNVIIGILPASTGDTDNSYSAQLRRLAISSVYEAIDIVNLESQGTQTLKRIFELYSICTRMPDAGKELANLYQLCLEKMLSAGITFEDAIEIGKFSIYLTDQRIKKIYEEQSKQLVRDQIAVVDVNFPDVGAQRLKALTDLSDRMKGSSVAGMELVQAAMTCQLAKPESQDGNPLRLRLFT